MSFDLQISQGVKTRFEPKLEKSCTFSLPVDLEKTLSELGPLSAFECGSQHLARSLGENDSEKMTADHHT